jgi:hypothetical protein
MLKYFLFTMLGLSFVLAVFLGPPLEELYPTTIELQSYIECGGPYFTCQFVNLEYDEEDVIYKVVCEDGTLALVPKSACMVFFKKVKVVHRDAK